MSKSVIQRIACLLWKAIALGMSAVIIAIGLIPDVTVEALSHTPSASASDAASGPGDPQEMEAFFDDFFTSKMAELQIPGAAIVVVRDGQVFLSKGYGYADAARRTQVDPTWTAFRAGSVSKLFTATAVMQVVERGLLDLDVDVNRYLADFQVPDTYPQPVPPAHLLTHIAGFEDRWIATATHDPEELEPLSQVLAGAMPERVEAPGVVHSYSSLLIRVIPVIPILTSLLSLVTLALAAIA